MSQIQPESVFSDYGIYKVIDNLELSLPDITIKIDKIGDHVFSYVRKDAEDNIVKKIIPTKSDDLTIELSPIRPLNYPAKRTSYVYLDFETPLFLSEGSAVTVFVRCPIEIGVFLVHDEHKDSLDCFTCDPNNSRFCLYGDPESGNLCKYALSEIVESYDDSIPFLNGVLKIDIKNDLDKGLTLSKIVFPITGNSIYYKNSKAIIDSLSAIMKKKLTIEIIDVTSDKIQTDWIMSPTFEQIESIKHMDMGVD
ncbi:MAG: DUF432 domain-containing protein [Nitrosopumilus sp.]|uniref:DUF432 domain-containing protein n=1 Tax=Nitrosopumilus sp. TaxID=2024843 RepID=UPI00242E1ACE|nr:DUF432 domain-containing protein [Nitrosopumilus sp.]MCV0366847.1 DUF432 domain-containing protein [Nitrosopumilus sp.]